MQNSPLPTYQYHTLLHAGLQSSYIFNSAMADHYRGMFLTSCSGWHFTKAALYFLKWQAYERKAAGIKFQIKQHK